MNTLVEVERHQAGILAYSGYWMAGGQCITGQRGPKCSSDKDCWGKTNCQRCAHSGYCGLAGLAWKGSKASAPSKSSGFTAILKHPPQELLETPTHKVIGAFRRVATRYGRAVEILATRHSVRQRFTA